MKIKTFQALTMSDAIRSIKQELGPDAVILSSKQIRKAGSMFGLFGRPMIEVAAAVDIEPQELHRAQRSAAAKRGTGQAGKAYPQTTQQATHRSGAAAYQSVHHPLQDSLRAKSNGSPNNGSPGQGRTVRPADKVKTQGRPFDKTQGRPGPAWEPATRWDDEEEPRFDAELQEQISRPHADEGEPQWRSMQEEIKGLRRLVETSLLNRRPAEDVEDEAQGGIGATGSSGLWAAWQQRLLQSGLESASVARLLKGARTRLQAGESGSEQALRQALHRALLREVKVGGPLLGLGEWKKTVIFTGPTGVGKTTTIAKLAAHYRLKEKRSVALITLDTYRVAAVEQLRMYANVIGVTMDVALTKREALECIRRRSKSELILIDTAGRSPRDEAGMEELREFIALDHPLETHLVLSAGTRERDLQDGATRYAGIPIDRLLFTKLDETSGFGGMVDLMWRTGLPMSYFSTGQRVPEDLEVVKPERVADLLLEGELKQTVKRET